MDKEVLTAIKFKENCEYQSSEIQTKIPIPQQIVQVSLDDPENKETPRNPNEFLYNDKIQLTAEAFQEKDGQKHYIKTGRIEFYFQANGSPDSELINTKNDSGILNTNGSAAILFKPTSSGKVFAKYIDDNDFYTAVTDTNPNGVSEFKELTISDIPVKINFTKSPPYIASVHDEVTIEVEVKHAKDNTNINYGTVTFGHYLVYDDSASSELRVPKIIGNPVPVINGKAKITYIPVQEDDYGYLDSSQDTEPEILIENNEKRYTEYIRASFNYSGKFIETNKETYKWKYYGTNSQWTSISIAKRNSLTIDSVSLPVEEGTKIYKCSEGETVTLSAVLKDKNNQYINFNNHSGKVYFEIKGTHAHPKKYYTPNPISVVYNHDFEQTHEDFNFITISERVEATYEKGTQNDKFTTNLTLLPGFYTISATSEIQTDDNGVLEPTTLHNIEAYDKSVSSNTIYIESTYTELPNYQLRWSESSTYVRTNTTIPPLSCSVQGLTQKQMSILNNQKCYFYIRNINKTYAGKLIYNNSTLVGTTTEDISFNIPNNYQVYMYIPDGVYTNNLSETEYHHNITSNSTDSTYDFYLPYIISDIFTIQARNDIELSLSLTSADKISPATVLCQVTGKYLDSAKTVQLYTQEINSSIPQLATTVNIHKEMPVSACTLHINTGGEYQIYAKSGEVESNRITVEISQDMLSQTLLSSSKTTFASVNNAVSMYLSTHRTLASNIDTSKIKAFLYNKDKEYQRQIPISSTKIMNNFSLLLEVKPGIYTEGTWYIKLTYQNADSILIQDFDGPLSEFTTILDTPSIKITPYDNNYDIQITGSHYSDKISNIVVAEVKFLRGPAMVRSGIIITDDKGHGSFNDTGVDTNGWWNGWDNIQFIFNPNSEEIIDILNKNHIPYNALKTRYTNVFDSHSSTRTENLYNQLIRNNSKYIYSNYKSTTDSTAVKVARPSQL